MANPRVVIIGAGFGGLTAAAAVGRLPVSVTLIDKKNHHTFQPVLYQVATAGLSPGEIAAPIRGVLRHYKNVTVLMADVGGFDLAKRRVKLSEFEIEYDYLIVAAGATHSYFGHEEWATAAPGLKTVEDALDDPAPGAARLRTGGTASDRHRHARAAEFRRHRRRPDRRGAGRDAGGSGAAHAGQRLPRHRSE